MGPYTLLIDIDYVAEIRGPEPRVCAGGRTEVKIRGTKIPVIQLESSLELPPKDSDYPAMLLVFLQGKMRALGIDSVGDIVTLPHGALKPILDKNAALLRVCTFEATIDNATAPVLDFSKLQMLERATDKRS